MFCNLRISLNHLILLHANLFWARHLTGWRSGYFFRFLTYLLSCVESDIIDATTEETISTRKNAENTRFQRWFLQNFPCWKGRRSPSPDPTPSALRPSELYRHPSNVFRGLFGPPKNFGMAPPMSHPARHISSHFRLPNQVADVSSIDLFKARLDNFYRAMHFSAFVRSCDRMSSVCPSVTLVICDHIDWKSWKLTAWAISSTSSLFAAKRRST